MRYVASKRIPLTFRSHSEKPSQKCDHKIPSHKAITHSAQGRLATHLPLATSFAGQRMLSHYKSVLRCAEHPSAYESGIFCLLFFAVEKKSVAARRRHRRSQRITGNKRCCRAKRLRRARHDLYGTPIPHSSLIGCKIRTHKKQTGIAFCLYGRARGPRPYDCLSSAFIRILRWGLPLAFCALCAFCG